MSLITEQALTGRMLIDGVWRPAQDGRTFDVTDPATGERIAQVADGGATDAVAAVTAADQAGRGWAATPPRERGEMLRRAHELMLSHADALARLITREMGKSLSEAHGEVTYAAEFFRWFAEEAVRIDGGLTTAPGGQYRMLTTPQPVGVCLLITPWNFPAAMATRKIGPALAAGCTVVLKPASATPLTSLAIADILTHAGVPNGVVNVITTASSSAVIDALLPDERIRKLSFTGSTEVGRSLLAGCAPTIKRTSMELGGNAPFLVLADADLDVAVSSAMAAKLRNIGQSCVAANRFYVHNAIRAEFVDRFAAELARQRVGHGLADGVDLGSLISTGARDDIVALIANAVDGGARLVTGGTPVGDQGAFLAPTLLDEVPLTARCLQQEIFGPVAPVVGFDTDEEAIAMANDTPYGLVGYVQTGDTARGLRVAEHLEVGMVGINRGVVSEPAAPFGGWKQSGLGREGGTEGIREYLETKYICVDW